jgi:hypothetical protein
MGENPQQQNSFLLEDNTHSEQVEALQEERIERRLSFYNKFANLKYGCILQAFSLGIVITFLVLDIIFKIIQSHTNDMIELFVNKFSRNKTKT